jgi:hypothetical protein
MGAVSGDAQMGESRSLRNLSGTITDSGHEPIRNAVVELRNSTTDQVITYITDTSGRYSFKRLDSHTDFQVWVLFRGRRSETRSISMFDSHLDKVINFTVRTY